MPKACGYGNETAGLLYGGGFKVSYKIVEAKDRIMNTQKSEEQLAAEAGSIHHYVRKAAHWQGVPANNTLRPAISSCRTRRYTSSARLCRYFDTCKADTYHRKLLGITASSAAEKEMQRCVDTWQMSQGLAERLHIQDDMELFCRAVSEEYQASREDGMTLEEAYREISS